MKRYLLTVAAVILAGSMHTSADEAAISISVRPRVASISGNARVKVLVAPNEMNRALIWEVDGENYYRSSSMQMRGASSPKSYFFLVEDLPPGLFEVRATVRRSDSSVVVDRSSLRVVGGPG